MRQGDLANGLSVLGGAIDAFPENAFHMRYLTFLGELAEGLGRVGNITAGLAMINRALDNALRCEERWCVAELFRIKGELVLKQGGTEAATSAEGLFQDALDWARRQNALSWELRVATSIARLWHDQGRRGSARELLGPVYGQFTEGFMTADLRAARELLDKLT